MYKKATIVLIGTSLLIAGCEGGGSSSSSTDTTLTYDGPTTAVVIDDTNADFVAAYAAEQATSGDLGDMGGGLVTTGIAVEAPTTTNKGIHHLSELAKEQAQKALDAASQSASNLNLLAGVSDSQTYACSGGGTYTISATVAYVNQYDEWVPTPGDIISMSYSNCREVDSYYNIDTTINGSMSLTLGALETDPYDSTILLSFSATMSFNNLKAVDNNTSNYSWVNGAMTVSMSGDGYTTDLVVSLTGDSLVAEQKYGGSVEQFALTTFSFVDTVEAATGNISFDHDFTIASTDIGGSITVVTVEPFVLVDNGGYYDDYPSSGVLIATGANDAKVQLTALNSTQVYVEYDLLPAGSPDGIYEANATLLWTEI